MAGPDNLYCFEKFNSTAPLCGFFDNPFQAVLSPITATLGDLTLVALWGILLGVLWIRTQNLMLVGMVGILVSSSLTVVYEPARGIGLLLMGVAIGVTLFQLIRHKISSFS
jgi:hypothetical protein|tara:strand:- start:217 stop:549 length:333 start_codon:yes stop_codon:yes gene_type:complete